MTFEEFKEEFDEMLSKMTDEEVVELFTRECDDYKGFPHFMWEEIKRDIAALHGTQVMCWNELMHESPTKETISFALEVVEKLEYHQWLPISAHASPDQSILIRASRSGSVVFMEVEAGYDAALIMTKEGRELSHSFTLQDLDNLLS